MRNDQLLAGRERARALIAVGGQDRLRRDAIALGQSTSSVSLVPTMIVVPPTGWAAATERGGTVAVVSDAAAPAAA